MSEIKQQAITLIDQIPEEEFSFVFTILQNIVTMLEVKSESGNLQKFKAAAGNVEIDAEAVENYRMANMI